MDKQNVEEMNIVIANLQRKYSQNIVEPGSEDVPVFQNNQYEEYFNNNRKSLGMKIGGVLHDQ